jgi:hypothetical protein
MVRYHQVAHRPPSDDPRRGPAASTGAGGFRTTLSAYREQRPPQPPRLPRAAFPQAFVDVFGDLIHDGSGRDHAVVQYGREPRFHGRKGMFSYPPANQQPASPVRILTQ